MDNMYCINKEKVISRQEYLRCHSTACDPNLIDCYCKTDKYLFGDKKFIVSRRKKLITIIQREDKLKRILS